MAETEENGGARVPAALRLYASVRDDFLRAWHWFGYHATRYTPFMRSLAEACVDLGRISSDAPQRMLGEVAAIGGTEGHTPHYDQLLQKLAEIIAMRQIVLMPWPLGTIFAIEPPSPSGPKRVDLVVTCQAGQVTGFEVKAPDLRAHAERRSQSNFQIPARNVPGMVERLQEQGNNLALPRDNTMRDFLRSANQKFEPFKRRGNFLGVLVVAWDDYVYEAIGPLVNPRSGLLTDASYSREGDEPERYPNIDCVIVLRHLSYVVSATKEHPLPDQRRDAFHVGGDGALPNVCISVPGGNAAPQFVLSGFNALMYDDPLIRNLPDYCSNELIIWTAY